MQLFHIVWCLWVGECIHIFPWVCRGNALNVIEHEVRPGCWHCAIDQFFSPLSYLTFVCWPTLDILWGCRQIWGRCNKGHPYGGSIWQNFDHASHIYVNLKVSYSGLETICVCDFHPSDHAFCDPSYLIWKVFTHTGLCFGIFITFLYSKATLVPSSMIVLEIMMR